jgi:hypothetical protein
MGGFGGAEGLAPWLRQGTAGFSPLQLGPQLGSSQAAKLAEQRALADQLRASSANTIANRKAAAGKPFSETYPTGAPAAPAGAEEPRTYAPPTQEGVPSSSPDALDPGYQDQQFGGHMDYSGEVPTFIQGPVNQADPYGFGPDYSDFYNKAHGAGSYDSEAARYAALDKANQLGDYEALFGEFPEDDPAAMENWFRAAGTEGTRVAGQQDTIAQNRRTDLTEAGIMTALTLGMGALTGPAAAAGMAGAGEEAAALGAGNLYGGAAGNGFSLASLAPTPAGLAATGAAAAYGGPEGYVPQDVGTLDLYGNPITAQTPSGALATAAQQQAYMKLLLAGGGSNG